MDQQTHRLAEDEEKRIALNLILDAWDEALKRGVSAESLASAAIYAALTDMVDLHGEGDVARMADGLGPRIRSGEFTFKR
jgi:transcription initiation factor TFIIIB Brf1 subunit/transcription initiation factor TFIIB